MIAYSVDIAVETASEPDRKVQICKVRAVQILKILLLHDYDTPFGGAEGGTFNLRAGLRARGHEVKLLSSTARPSGMEGGSDIACYGTLSAGRTLLQVANPFAAATLGRVLKEFRPDVVHVRMFLTQLSPLILPQLAGVPSLYHAVWYRAVCPLGTKMLPNGAACSEPAGLPCLRHSCLSPQAWAPMMVQMAMLRRWRGAFNRVVANSAAVADRLAAGGFSGVDVVWNGVAPGAPRPPLTGPPTIGFAGRFVREKGVDVLVRAFAIVVRQLPQARLLLIGDGPDRGAIADLVAGLGLTDHVTFTGQVPPGDVNSYLDQTWVQSVPSVWAEPFGFAAAEAMMRGAAVVASSSGGLGEIVQDRVTGRKTPPGDHEALASALTEVLSDRTLAERYGEAGRAFALSHLTHGQWLDRFEAIYREMLGDAPHG